MTTATLRRSINRFHAIDDAGHYFPETQFQPIQFFRGLGANIAEGRLGERICQLVWRINFVEPLARAESAPFCNSSFISCPWIIEVGELWISTYRIELFGGEA